MKSLFSLAIIALMTAPAFAQIENDNTMRVLIDGTELIAQPRRITIGNYSYITGNVIGPDKSLRIWLGAWDGSTITDSGSYLVVGDENDREEKTHKAWESGDYKGLAVIKYVEETKSPRIEYHVGNSLHNGESIHVSFGEDDHVEVTFDNVTLDGSWWKERTSTTVLGGVGRLTDKMQDKAVTKATGYEQDMDPEGWGYKELKQTDQIVLTECTIRLKMQ